MRRTGSRSASRCTTRVARGAGREGRRVSLLLHARRSWRRSASRPRPTDVRRITTSSAGSTAETTTRRTRSAFTSPRTATSRSTIAIRGEVTWRKESLGDFIIVRSDGFPTYNFCVVVDDHDMEITHVIRAEEHLTNTHRQVLIYRAMGWDVPQFAHVSLILGQDRTKLSKRHGATSVSAYAEEGFLPDAMVNYLTLLGWSSPDGLDVFSREYAIEKFSLDRVNAAPAVFDPQKFEWLNGQYIHAMSAGELAPLVRPFFDAPWLEEGIDVVKTSVHRLTRVRGGAAIRRSSTRRRRSIARSRRSSRKSCATNGTPTDEASYKAMVERLEDLDGHEGEGALHAAAAGDHGARPRPGARARDPAAAARERSRSARALAARARRAHPRSMIYRAASPAAVPARSRGGARVDAEQIAASAADPDRACARSSASAARRRRRRERSSDCDSVRRSASPAASTRTRR